MAARRATKGQVLIRPGNPITFEIELKMNQATLTDVADAVLFRLANLGDRTLSPAELATRCRLESTWSELDNLLTYLELARKLNS